MVHHYRTQTQISKLPRALLLVKADIQDPLRAVLPLPLHTTSLKPASLKAIFSSLSTLGFDDLPEVLPPFAQSIEEVQNSLGIAPRGVEEEAEDPEQEDVQRSEAVKGEESAEDKSSEIDKETIYMAIVTSDSTVVYYRLSRGIRKPADIPDE